MVCKDQLHTPCPPDPVFPRAHSICTATKEPKDFDFSSGAERVKKITSPDPYSAQRARSGISKQDVGSKGDLFVEDPQAIVLVERVMSHTFIVERLDTASASKRLVAFNEEANSARPLKCREQCVLRGEA